MRQIRYLLPTLLVALAVVVFNVNASDREIDALKEKFLGHYELISFVQFPAEGGEVDMNYEGRITYDAYGNMTAQGMPKDLPARAAATDELVRGGFAYYGTVHFDLENNVVIHKVQGSPTRGSWVGEDNVRYFEFTDDYLKLSMKDDSGRTTGTLTWRKFEQ